MALTATIDRFEGERNELAVLIEDSGSGREALKVNVERSLLPDGAQAGDVIALSGSLGEGQEENVRGALAGARLERRTTRERRERVGNRIERLEQKGGRKRRKR